MNFVLRLRERLGCADCGWAAGVSGSWSPLGWSGRRGEESGVVGGGFQEEGECESLAWNQDVFLAFSREINSAGSREERKTGWKWAAESLRCLTEGCPPPCPYQWWVMKLFLLKEKKKLLVSLICVFLSLVFISFTSALIFSIPFLLPTLGSFLLFL